MLRLAVGTENSTGFLTDFESSRGLRSYFETVIALLATLQYEIETHAQALRIRR